jgi:hypothetical protein
MSLPLVTLIKELSKTNFSFDAIDFLRGYYTVFAFASILFMLIITLIIFLHDSRAIKRNPRDYLGMGAFDRVILFAVYGGGRLWRAMEEERRRLSDLHTSTLRVAHLERIAEATKALTFLMISALGAVGTPTRRMREVRDGLVDEILSSIEATVRSFAYNPERFSLLRANYMAAVR